MTRYGSHTESRMRENCTYGSMRGRAYPTGESRSTLHPTIVNKIKGLRGFGGGKHAFYRSFRVDG